MSTHQSTRWGWKNSIQVRPNPCQAGSAGKPSVKSNPL
jgi:hypothetical protein